MTHVRQASSFLCEVYSPAALLRWVFLKKIRNFLFLNHSINDNCTKVPSSKRQQGNRLKPTGVTGCSGRFPLVPPGLLEQNLHSKCRFTGLSNVKGGLRNTTLGKQW